MRYILEFTLDTVDRDALQIVSDNLRYQDLTMGDVKRITITGYDPVGFQTGIELEFNTFEAMIKYTKSK